MDQDTVDLGAELCCLSESNSGVGVEEELGQGFWSGRFGGVRATDEVALP